VARVDAYIVSVTGGGPHVGERRMVRIETVGRSAATGVLLDEDGNEAPQVQSGASAGRRRGRRGGRRRSGAQSGKQSGE
jgi:hypothetical protein